MKEDKKEDDEIIAVIDKGEYRIVFVKQEFDTDLEDCYRGFAKILIDQALGR